MTRSSDFHRGDCRCDECEAERRSCTSSEESELASLRSEVERLRRQVERLVAGYPKAFKHGWMYGHTAPLAVESGKTTDEMVDMTWKGSVPQKQLDAILADEDPHAECRHEIERLKSENETKSAKADLLRACQMIVEGWDASDGEMWLPDHCGPGIEAARKAIAKATGEENAG